MEDQEKWEALPLKKKGLPEMVKYDKPNLFEKLLLEIFDEILNDDIITSSKFRENVLRARFAVREVQANRLKGKKP